MILYRNWIKYIYFELFLIAIRFTREFLEMFYIPYFTFIIEYCGFITILLIIVSNAHISMQTKRNYF